MAEEEGQEVIFTENTASASWITDRSQLEKCGPFLTPC